MKKRIILAARYYSIEPLGILYLAGLVRDCGWECKVVLVPEFNFEPLYEAVRDWKPDMVGFQIWTGYHLPAFAACDRVRAAGVPVIIGGPHATYFAEECEKHADWVVKASGFDMLREILRGTLPRGVHFDKEGRESHFPLPDRDLVYEAYPALGQSPIKSIFASVGCPYTCTYCYAPTFNTMHGGFRLTMRSVDDIIAEARAIQKRWPLKMVYFQDDIFGFKLDWLAEFARRWKREVGVAFHCQIRLELTRKADGDKRLDLFAEAGCTGITLAIESGNAFLRDHVLFRHMPDELIVEGCRKIMDRGMTLRTEQILAVPFSDTATDLATLDLNHRIGAEMAWTSILGPYGGTDMGMIAYNFDLYRGNNDDLAETFFEKSVLQHVAGGPRDIGRIVQAIGAQEKDRPLLKLRSVRNGLTGTISSENGEVGTIEYLNENENERYCEDVVRMQRLFNFLARVPGAKALGAKVVGLNDNEWSWEQFGRTVEGHLRYVGKGAQLEDWKQKLAREMNLQSANALPEPIAQNPHYFCYMPEGAGLAHKALSEGVFAPERTTSETFNRIGTMTRRHLFEHGLYKISPARKEIAL